MNYRQFLMAQFGKRDERRKSLSMLLSTSELSGDSWKMTGQRSWRVGMDEFRDERFQRARIKGLFAATRAFEQKGTERWVYVKIIPMESYEDALFELPGIGLNFMIAPRSGTVLEGERAIPLDIEMDLENARATELTFTQSTKVARYRCVVGNLENVIALICCSGLDEGWSWDELQFVSSAQALKMRRVLGVSAEEL